MTKYILPKAALTLALGLSALSFTSVTVSAEPATSAKQQMVSSIPDLRNEKDVKTKKRKFFNALRPMVIEENKRVAAQRNFLLGAQKNTSLSAPEDKKVDVLLKSYRLKRGENNVVPWAALMKRVDTVPLELVLSQAANESAWGTSRFARKANNLFGQWCFTKGCGLVPARRNAGTTHEVAAFKSPQLSVRSYLRNLNTGRVYADLRTIRAQKRAAGQTATASELAGGLSKYSERGQAYVKEIRSMIRYNGKYMRGEG
ncbi:MAG: glucosaminidase domain-containing protein [Ghiorsea sp.]